MEPVEKHRLLKSCLLMCGVALFSSCYSTVQQIGAQQQGHAVLATCMPAASLFCASSLAGGNAPHTANHPTMCLLGESVHWDHANRKVLKSNDILNK